MAHRRRRLGHFRAGQVHRESARGARVLWFRGYEAWQTISISRNEKVVAVILGNPVMIDAYQAGIPANGKPVPDGAKMARSIGPRNRTRFSRRRPCRAACERGLHGEGQQEVRGQRRMGICRVRLQRRVRYVHARHPRARRRKGTTPSADLRATRERRPETTSSRSTGSGEPVKRNFVALTFSPVRRSIPGAIHVSRRSWRRRRWAGASARRLPRSRRKATPRRMTHQRMDDRQPEVHR